VYAMLPPIWMKPIFPDFLILLSVIFDLLRRFAASRSLSSSCSTLQFPL